MAEPKTEKGPGSAPGPNLFSVRTERLRIPGPPAGRPFRFLFVPIEPADDIGADGPRCNLRGLRLLAFAVRLLVGRANERVFNEHVRLS